MSDTENETPTEPQEPTEPVAPVEPTEEPVAPEAPETPDEPEEPEAPEEPEQPSQPAPPTPEALEKADKSLERSVSTYVGAIGRYQEATGQELFRTGVDLPGIPGFIFDPRQVPLNEEQVTAARMLGGLEVSPPLEADPLSQECTTCKGWGRLRVPTHVPENEIAKCDTCDGYGFTGPRLAQIKASAVPVGPAVASTTATTQLAEPPRDQWGTPLGHPGFGQPPDKWPLEWHNIPTGLEAHVNTTNLQAVS